MPTIDADGHVVETPRTWSYLREDENQFHPLIYVRNPNDGAGSSARYLEDYWVIDGKLVKVCSWYDNEWGFSNRMLDTTLALANAK